MTERAPGAVTRRIQALDYLRLVAALMVVGFHWIYNGITNGKIASLDTYWPIASVARYGYLDVEIFFVISGYVIMHSCRGKSARQFAIGRAVRLYPAFWVAMILTATVMYFWGAESGLFVGPRMLIANLTMIPGALGATLVDGVYWTLEVELRFYAIVFVLLLARLGPQMPKLLALWGWRSSSCPTIRLDSSTPR